MVVGCGVHEPGCGWVLEELVVWSRSQVRRADLVPLCLERMIPLLCEGGCEVGQAHGQGRGLGRPQACTDGRQGARRSPRQGLNAGRGEREPSRLQGLGPLDEHSAMVSGWEPYGQVPCVSLADSGLPRAVHTLATLVFTHPPPSPQLCLSASPTLIPFHCLLCSGPPKVGGLQGRECPPKQSQRHLGELAGAASESVASVAFCPKRRPKLHGLMPDLCSSPAPLAPNTGQAHLGNQSPLL